MTHAYLAPFWQLMLSLSFMLAALAAYKWRTALYARGHYLPLVVLFLFPVAFFLMSIGVKGGVDATLRRATPMLMAGSGVLFLAAILLVVAIAKMARADSAPGVK